MKFTIDDFKKGGVATRKDMIVQKKRRFKARILSRAGIGIAVTGLLIASGVRKQKLEEGIIERAR